MSWSLAASLLRVPGDAPVSPPTVDVRLVREIMVLEQCLCDQRLTVSEYERKVAMLIRPGQIHYSNQLQRLYFVDGRGQTIRNALQRVVEGMGLPYEPRPISSDEHGIFVNGFTLPLPRSGRRTVAVALRLTGAAVF